MYNYKFNLIEQALKLPPNAPYNCRWPMKFGQLNTHNGIGGSLSSITTDLETLWGKAIEKYLDIPLKDLSYYRAVLLLPDMINRNHAKLLIDVILNCLKFSCVLVHQVQLHFNSFESLVVFKKH